MIHTRELVRWVYEDVQIQLVEQHLGIIPNWKKCWAMEIEGRKVGFVFNFPIPVTTLPTFQATVRGMAQWFFTLDEAMTWVMATWDKLHGADEGYR